MPMPYSVYPLNRLAGMRFSVQSRGAARKLARLPGREWPPGYFLLEPSVAQPPLPLQEFLPLQPLSLDLQPPLPLHEFSPLQACFSTGWSAACPATELMPALADTSPAPELL